MRALRPPVSLACSRHIEEINHNSRNAAGHVFNSD
jgi:hypothetical protein